MEGARFTAELRQHIFSVYQNQPWIPLHHDVAPWHAVPRLGETPAHHHALLAGGNERGWVHGAMEAPMQPCNPAPAHLLPDRVLARRCRHSAIQVEQASHFGAAAIPVWVCRASMAATQASVLYGGRMHALCTPDAPSSIPNPKAQRRRHPHCTPTALHPHGVAAGAANPLPCRQQQRHTVDSPRSIHHSPACGLNRNRQQNVHSSSFVMVVRRSSALCANQRWRQSSPAAPAAGV